MHYSLVGFSETAMLHVQPTTADGAPNLRPRRFCGSAEFARVLPAYDEWLVYERDAFVLDDQVQTKLESFDAVSCEACCVTAPLTIWQSEPGTTCTPGRLDAYRRYLAAGCGHSVAA